MDSDVRFSNLERRLSAALAENKRLRNLLKVTDGVEPPPSQPVLVVPDPGVVTNDFPITAKMALFANRFAAR